MQSEMPLLHARQQVWKLLQLFLIHHSLECLLQSLHIDVLLRGLQRDENLPIIGNEVDLPDLDVMSAFLELFVSPQLGLSQPRRRSVSPKLQSGLVEVCL